MEYCTAAQGPRTVFVTVNADGLLKVPVSVPGWLGEVEFVVTVTLG
jgi:hypothetical protein